ncbi:Plug domain-containing protein [Cellulophaga sp. HaHaR_3_176]|uniref:Plug domain-containing protein n=1 Tax=Cellulophaga sp. HaHaR_3_176 TaxID=1942464 RepID=UPI001C1FBAA4|nr:Plug domain-containing protein [Cellulophaga sp. HaHaR_3_176]QWX85460.1 Plug domain-containing protein [Cellulophaga sp. HaHaR_3_176]
MKNLVLIAAIIFCSYQLEAQNNNSALVKNTILAQKENTDIRLYRATHKNTSIPLLDDTSINKEHPFKIYQIENSNFNTQQDVFNAIRSIVPGVSISNTNFNQTPNITIRGDANTIVILDGVRYNASILNTLNPQDIERISVATSNISNNYLGYIVN